MATKTHGRVGCKQRAIRFVERDTRSLYGVTNSVRGTSSTAGNPHTGFFSSGFGPSSPRVRTTRGRMQPAVARSAG
jgi:hypothetical protein